MLPQLLDLCQTYQDLNFHEFQILVPMYKGLHGIDLINKKLEFKYCIGHGLFLKKSIIEKIGFFSENEINSFIWL